MRGVARKDWCLFATKQRNSRTKINWSVVSVAMLGDDEGGGHHTDRTNRMQSPITLMTAFTCPDLCLPHVVPTPFVIHVARNRKPVAKSRAAYYSRASEARQSAIHLLGEGLPYRISPAHRSRRRLSSGKHNCFSTQTDGLEPSRPPTLRAFADNLVPTSVCPQTRETTPSRGVKLLRSGVSTDLCTPSELKRPHRRSGPLTGAMRAANKRPTDH